MPAVVIPMAYVSCRWGSNADVERYTSRRSIPYALGPNLIESDRWPRTRLRPPTSMPLPFAVSVSELSMPSIADGCRWRVAAPGAAWTAAVVRGAETAGRALVVDNAGVITRRPGPRVGQRRPLSHVAPRPDPVETHQRRTHRRRAVPPGRRGPRCLRPPRRGAGERVPREHADARAQPDEWDGRGS